MILENRTFHIVLYSIIKCLSSQESSMCLCVLNDFIFLYHFILFKRKKVQFNGKSVHWWPLVITATLYHQKQTNKQNENENKNWFHLKHNKLSKGKKVQFKEKTIHCNPSQFRTTLQYQITRTFKKINNNI